MPLIHRSTQELTSFLREASVSAASEKYAEPVQPPSEISTRSFGFLRLELGELVEVAGDRLAGDVADAVDAELGGERASASRPTGRRRRRRRPR